MLTMNTLKSAKKATDYYQEDYYAKEDGSQGVWFGEGAKLLGKSGGCSVEQFKAALEGKLAPDIDLKGNKQVHRPGYDLTFSAPKSVSILAVITKDERIFETHRLAVDETLKYIEEHYGATRLKSDGQVNIEKTKNLLAVKFEHTDSRALDPNLHTHTVIMNATKRDDGHWRTLYFDEIYDNKMLFGAIYRGLLAQGLMTRGFEITQTTHTGLFELKAFSQILIDQMSKRREQIVTELDNLGLSGAKAAQIANFNTRDAKVKIDPKQLESDWTIELQKCGFSIEWLKEYSNQAAARGSVTPLNPYNLVYSAVNQAACELSVWKSVFNIDELKKLATGISVNSGAPMILDKVIAEQFKNGDLLFLKDNLCTTQAARDLEMLNVLNMKQGKNKVLPMVTNLGANYLAIHYHDAICTSLKTLLTNSDNQMVVISSSLKNYIETLKPLVEISYQHGACPIGITQTFKRLKDLSKELGIKRTQTIEGFLLSCENRTGKIGDQGLTPMQLMRSKQIWILDFHSSISATQLNRLQNYAKQFGTRIIWSYKTQKPQAAISALIDHGIKKCNLNQQIEQPMSALSYHPQLNQALENAGKSIDKHDWQNNTANVLLHWTIQHYQERNAVFELKDLKLQLFSLGITVPKEILQSHLDAALESSLKPVKRILVTTKDGVVTIQDPVDLKQIDQSVVATQDPVDLKEIDQPLVTTQYTINLEQTCLQEVLGGKNTLPAIVNAPQINKNLTAGQQQAIELILTTQDRVVGIQGVAGSGKTTMLKELNKQCLANNYEIIGLTVTTGAKERLKEGSYDNLTKAGIKNYTVRGFLIDSERLLSVDKELAKIEYGGNKLFILDEASFASTAEMLALINKMKQLNTKMVVIGDYCQLQSIEAGRIFYLMLGSKMRSVAMLENVRFKSAKTLEVMQEIYKDAIPQALEKLADSLIEIPDYNARLQKMASLYLEKSRSEQANTILITPEHKDRKIVNTLIRNELKRSGMLIGTEVNLEILTQISLTKPQQQNIYYFNENNWVCFIKKPRGLEVKLNEHYQIIEKNLEEKILVLQGKNSESILWKPDTQACQVSLYFKEQRSLMQNDSIRWSRNNNLHGIYNGQTAIVMKQENDLVDFKLQDGRDLSLNVTELNNQHWDHAYAATAFVAQGADKLHTIALARGAYSQEKISGDLKKGDVVITKDQVLKSQWAKILAVQNGVATVQDRELNTFNVDLSCSPTDLYSNGQAMWRVCSDPTTRKPSAIPKLTSVSEFLVSVTRGDNVTLLVDHIESYQHALEQTVIGARSATEYLCSPKELKVLRDQVASMTSNVTGKAIQSLADQSSVDKASKSVADHKQPPPKQSLHTNFVTMEEVVNKLHANVINYTTNWLGKPEKITTQEARWGKKGSLVVKLQGSQAGYWHDFERGVGGKNLLSLYIDKFNCDFKTAMHNFTTELNLDTDKLFQNIDKPKAAAIVKIDPIDPKKIKFAQKIYHQGIPIDGTLAEKYLREFRGIIGNIPEDFKFCAKVKHPDLGRMVPALLAPIKNGQNEVQGVVRIFLNANGDKLQDTYLNTDGKSLPATVKANLGSMANAAVTVNQGKFPGTIYIAEGIETALSIAQTKPLDAVFATLSVSNLSKVLIPADTQKVVLCADYDGVGAASNKALMAAANFYLERGLSVAIAHPEKIIGMNKVDFNDVLKHLGADSIVRSLQNAVPQLAKNNIEQTKTTELQNVLNIKRDNLQELTR